MSRLPLEDLVRLINQPDFSVQDLVHPVEVLGRHPHLIGIASSLASSSATSRFPFSRSEDVHIGGNPLGNVIRPSCQVILVDIHISFSAQNHKNAARDQGVGVTMIKRRMSFLVTCFSSNRQLPPTITHPRMVLIAPSNRKISQLSPQTLDVGVHRPGILYLS